MKNARKRLCLGVVWICLCSLAVFSVPVMAESASEEMNNGVMLEDAIIEEATNEDDLLKNIPDEEEVLSDCMIANEGFTPSNLPRYAPEVSVFNARYSNEQKAAKLRDFLLERLNNMELYRNELSLGEYHFDSSGASDVLYVDLSGLSEFSLYYDAANQSSTKEIIRNAMNDIGGKSPRTFWCENYYAFFYNTNDYKITKLGMKLDCGKDFDVEDGLQPVMNEVNSLTAEFDNYVQSIVDLIPDSYSDYEKILFANDYLCTNYKYDINLLIHNPYDFFKQGKGVCQAYTLAFMAIMDELGIRCDSVSSEEMNHIWNLVELNEKWYHIDVTWNDPCFMTLENDTLGKVSHRWFLLSSECMQDSTHRHSGFDVESYGYEFGTEFDEIEVNLDQSLRTSFVELNGTWYNTAYNEAKHTCGLYVFDSPDISSMTNKDLKTTLYAINSWEYKGSFSYLSKYKDTILFNTPTSICAFDGNEVAELYVPEKEENERIYGFMLKDDTIYMQLATNPNEDGMRNAVVKTVNLVDLIGPSIKEYDEITKKATIYAPVDIEATLVFASYGKNDRLMDCEFKIYSGDNKITTGMNQYTAPDGFDINGAEKIKIMIWENTTLKPMCEVYEK